MIPKPAWNVPCKIINDALKQIFQLPRAVGTFPFSDQFKLSLWRSFILVGLSIFSSYHIFITEYSFFDSLTYSPFNILTVAKMLNVCILVLANLFCPVTKASKFQLIRKTLNEIELSIHMNVFNWKYELKWYKLNLNFILIICSHVFIYILLKVNVSLAISYLIVEFNFSTVISQTCGLLSLIGASMHLIKHIHDSKTQVKLDTNLIFVTNVVNDYFGPRLFFITSGILFRSSQIIYMICINRFNSTFYPFLIIICLTLPLGQLILSVTLLKRKVNEINEHLYKKLMANPDDEVLDFYLTSKTEFVFTACGFFNFENALIGSIIVATTTYMVILLQYSPFHG